MPIEEGICSKCKGPFAEGDTVQFIGGGRKIHTDVRNCQFYEDRARAFDRQFLEHAHIEFVSTTELYVAHILQEMENRRWNPYGGAAA